MYKQLFHPIYSMVQWYLAGLATYTWSKFGLTDIEELKSISLY